MKYSLVARTRIWQSFTSQNDTHFWSSCETLQHLAPGNISSLMVKCVQVWNRINHKIFSWWLGIFSRMRRFEYQEFLPCKRDDSLNIMTGLYCVLNNISTICVKFHFKWYNMYVSWAEIWYNSLIMQNFHMISLSRLRSAWAPREPREDMYAIHPPYWRIYVPVNWVSIGSGNGLSPIQRQAIIWTNAINWNLGNKLQWNLTDRNTNFSPAKMHLKMSSWPFCPGWS